MLPHILTVYLMGSLNQHCVNLQGLESNRQLVKYQNILYNLSYTQDCVH